VWLTTEEAETDPVVKQKFLTATAADTVRSRSLTGKPARMLRTPWTDEWARPDTPDPLPMPLQGVLVAEAQARIHRSAHHAGSGAEQLDTYFVGQVVGSLNRVKSARQVVLDMVDEYIDTYQRLRRLTEED
jgi:NAD(P)H-dependent flavin oxidoreductase YrpB (nitropropane dioxygenase family)